MMHNREIDVFRTEVLPPAESLAHLGEATHPGPGGSITTRRRIIRERTFEEVTRTVQAAQATLDAHEPAVSLALRIFFALILAMITLFFGINLVVATMEGATFIFAGTLAGVLLCVAALGALLKG